VIFSASADTASMQHSSLIFEPLVHWLFPHMSDVQVADIHHYFRKSAHMGEYGVLALLLWIAIRRTRDKVQGRWLWSDACLSLILVFLYAGSDEFHQTFIPNRTGQFSDVLVDTAGGAVGLAFLWLAGKVFRRW